MNTHPAHRLSRAPRAAARSLPPVFPHNTGERADDMSNVPAAAEAAEFLHKHGELTYSAAWRAMAKLTENGFRIQRPAPAVPDDVSKIVAELARLKDGYSKIEAAGLGGYLTPGLVAEITRAALSHPDKEPTADAILRLLEAHTAEQTAPSAAPVAEPVVWSGVENAPYDTPLTVLAGGMTFAAILRRDASLNEEGESCDQWQAVVEGEHPPCWTDGACWESNEDGIPCLWPEAFMPLTKPADFRTAVKGSRT